LPEVLVSELELVLPLLVLLELDDGLLDEVEELGLLAPEP
jgi:hypothetical protein